MNVTTFNFPVDFLSIPTMDLIGNTQRHYKIYTILLPAVSQPWLVKHYASSAVVFGCDSNPHSRTNFFFNYVSKLCFLNFSRLAYS
jgi:hypothetical protein